MRDEKPRGRSVIQFHKPEACDAPSAIIGDSETARIIEAALLPLRSRLSREQLDIIRSVLRSGIETDPVARVLAERSVRTNTASMRLQRS